VLDWPPFSPDLNPIEHTWARLKIVLYQLYPDLGKWPDDYDIVELRIRPAIRHAWNLIDHDFWESLTRSMSTRINALIEADG
jgi:hypothetical protein